MTEGRREEIVCDYISWGISSPSKTITPIDPVTPSEVEGSGRDRRVHRLRGQMSRLRYAALDMTEEDRPTKISHARHTLLTVDEDVGGRR